MGNSGTRFQDERLVEDRLGLAPGLCVGVAEGTVTTVSTVAVERAIVVLSTVAVGRVLIHRRLPFASSGSFQSFRSIVSRGVSVTPSWCR